MTRTTCDLCGTEIEHGEPKFKVTTSPANTPAEMYKEEFVPDVCYDCHNKVLTGNIFHKYQEIK